MHLLNRKNRWQRLLEPVAGASPGRSMVRSGLVTAGTVAGLTVVSAVISALRQDKDER